MTWTRLGLLVVSSTDVTLAYCRRCHKNSRRKSYSVQSSMVIPSKFWRFECSESEIIVVKICFSFVLLWWRCTLVETRKEDDQILGPCGNVCTIHRGKKSQTWHLVGVTGGPLETFFVKKNFKIRVKKFCPSLPAILFHFFPRQARAKIFYANFEIFFNKKCF